MRAVAFAALLLLVSGCDGTATARPPQQIVLAGSAYAVAAPDDETRRVSAQFAGKRIYPIGPWFKDSWCVFGRQMQQYPDGFHGAEIATRVVRVRNLAMSIAIDPVAFSTEEFSDHVHTTSPIVVLLSNNGGCPMRFLAAPAAWALQRDITTSPLHVLHPDWPPRIMNAIAKGEVVMGMTRAQVAWAYGFPPHPGTIEQLNRLGGWNYEYPPPGGGIITFENDKVAGCYDIRLQKYAADASCLPGK